MGNPDEEDISEKTNVKVSNKGKEEETNEQDITTTENPSPEIIAESTLEVTSTTSTSPALDSVKETTSSPISFLHLRERSLPKFGQSCSKIIFPHFTLLTPRSRTTISTSSSSSMLEPIYASSSSNSIQAIPESSITTVSAPMNNAFIPCEVLQECTNELVMKEKTTNIIRVLFSMNEFPAKGEKISDIETLTSRNRKAFLQLNQRVFATVDEIEKLLSIVLAHNEYKLNAMKQFDLLCQNTQLLKTDIMNILLLLYNLFETRIEQKDDIDTLLKPITDKIITLQEYPLFEEVIEILKKYCEKQKFLNEEKKIIRGKAIPFDLLLEKIGPHNKLIPFSYLPLSEFSRHLDKNKKTTLLLDEFLLIFSNKKLCNILKIQYIGNVFLFKERKELFINDNANAKNFFLAYYQSLNSKVKKIVRKKEKLPKEEDLKSADFIKKFSSADDSNEKYAAKAILLLSELNANDENLRLALQTYPNKIYTFFAYLNQLEKYEKKAIKLENTLDDQEKTLILFNKYLHYCYPGLGSDYKTELICCLTAMHSCYHTVYKKIECALSAKSQDTKTSLIVKHSVTCSTPEKKEPIDESIDADELKFDAHK